MFHRKDLMLTNVICDELHHSAIVRARAPSLPTAALCFSFTQFGSLLWLFSMMLMLATVAICGAFEWRVRYRTRPVNDVAECSIACSISFHNNYLVKFINSNFNFTTHWKLDGMFNNLKSMSLIDSAIKKISSWREEGESFSLDRERSRYLLACLACFCIPNSVSHNRQETLLMDSFI